MTAENAQECFGKSVDAIGMINGCDEYSDAFNGYLRAGKIKVEANSLVHEFRISDLGLNNVTIVIIPQDYCKEWGGDSQNKAVAGVVMNAVASAGHLSGPSLSQFEMRKNTLLLKL